MVLLLRLCDFVAVSLLLLVDDNCCWMLSDNVDLGGSSSSEAGPLVTMESEE